MFYHIQQISGIITLVGFPNTSQIIFPNLRLIQADPDNLFANQNSLTVLNSQIGELVLPSLTQITYGNVFFENTSSLCNYLTVNWTDIIDNGAQVEGLGACDPVNNPQHLACEFKHTHTSLTPHTHTPHTHLTHHSSHTHSSHTPHTTLLRLEYRESMLAL